MARRKPTNGSIANGLSTTVPKAASWAAFDALPRAVRQVLWAAPMPINPIGIRELLLEAGAAQTVSLIGQAIEHEIALFDEQHRQQHRYELPHTAARVSRQPYDSQATPRRLMRFASRHRPHYESA